MLYPTCMWAQSPHMGKSSICGTYNHEQYLEGRREMMQWYGNYLYTLIVDRDSSITFPHLKNINM